MKNQEIKGQSCLTLEKLSDNELENVFGGSDLSKCFMDGFCTLPRNFIKLVSGVDAKGKSISRAKRGTILAGQMLFVAVFDIVCYGIYKGGRWTVKKIEARFNKKTEKKSLSNNGAI